LEFPNELSSVSVDSLGISAEAVGTFGKGKHVFSHIEWHMTSLVLDAKSDTVPEGYVWADLSRLREVYAVPAAFSDFMDPLFDLLKNKK
jgi:A/G-specific adenine glycosylase